MAKSFSYDVWRTPQQGRFLFSDARYPAYFGGFANGKSFILCLRAWMHSMKYPGNRGVIARRHVKELRDTTRAEFFALVGCNETTIADHPLVERWNQTENMLRLKNGSEVFFRHVDDDESLRALLSLNLRWFGIDQAEEVTEAAFLFLMSRIGRTKFDPRTTVPLPPPWGAVTGNPAGHNWVWKIWKKKADEKGWTGRKFHLEEATTYEGPYVDAEYIADLKEQYPDRWFRRYVLGSWDVAYGLIYDEFDSGVHVIDPVEIKDEWKAGIGVDLGYNHPTAFIWVAIDYNGNWIVYDEHVASELIPDEHAPLVKKKGIVRENGDYLPVYGPHDAMNRSGISGENHQAAYARNGIYMMAGNRQHVTVRIQRIKSMLKVREGVEHPYKAGINRSPRLFIFRTCSKILDEISLYRWFEPKPADEGKKADPDEVIKVHDDALDALGSFALGHMSRYIPERPLAPTPIERDWGAFPSLGRSHDIDAEIEQMLLIKDWEYD